MELSSRAAPGVEKYAEHAVENACHLADAACGAGGWSAAAADDALEAIDTLAAALSALGPEVAGVLAPVTAAAAGARRVLGLPGAVEEETAGTAGTVPAARTAPRPRRRGLGPGFQGIRSHD